MRPMRSPRLAASLASASLVAALSTSALAGEATAPDSESSEDGDARPTADGSSDRASAHRPSPKRAATAQLPTEPPEEVWYGYQILLVDGALVGLVFPTSGFTSLGVFLGGPVVHLANGHPWRAVGSYLLRTGMFGAGALIGVAVGNAAEKRAHAGCVKTNTEDCHSEWPGLMEALIGGFAGLIGASVIDATVLAWEDAPAATPASTGVRVAPSLAMVEGGGTLGIAGVF